MSEGKKGTLDILIGFKTSNGNSGTFNPWNAYALQRLGYTGGALDPKMWSYHVHGNLYEVPDIARKNHECGGSVNVYGVDPTNGNSIGLSHVFYIDETGHGGRPYHWNHEIYTRKGHEEWVLFDKDKTEYHIIPISDWIELSVNESNGNIITKKVDKNNKK
jgi:hypothetical protein